ncbi:MAG: thioredoxin domain-containing protein, partial [Acidimicrobiales bacterium]
MAASNRLAGETSPYLRQHAGNPVDWFAWGEEAFEAAKHRDVPVLLSIGYSACHWCHVMAHESFEDQAVASVVNEHFVAVKVDREERPDVDAVYLEAVQAITGGGGWPMTVFLLPDGRPFFGGTYFPKDRFLDLLARVDDAWRTKRPELTNDADHLVDAIRKGTALPSAGWAADGDPRAARSPFLLAATADALLSRFDPEWGGFGPAPKFPQPPTLELLLQAWDRTGRDDIAAALNTTLDAIASGGIYDHVGGGFARYATDRQWLVPHFEKMLYDNALLARLYARAWAATGEAHYRQVVEETVAYLLRPPIRLPDGGLSSAEDADSEGEEGRFYVWSYEELVEVGGEPAAVWYGATPGGNWEGRNILWRPERGVLARPDAVEDARAALYERREQRVRPGLDDKVLTEWNAMAVAALAEAGRLLARADWVAAAAGIAEFLLEALCPEGRWLRSWQAGRARHAAYASDHAWLVEAFTRLAEATGEARWIEQATTVGDAL